MMTAYHRNCVLILLSLGLFHCVNAGVANGTWLDSLNALHIGDRFSVIFYDEPEDMIYAGGVNYLYKIDARNITQVIFKTEWTPDPISYNVCMRFKKDRELCTNTIKILVSLNSTHLYTCGTMAYNPSCGHVKKDILEVMAWTVRSQSFRAPHDPYTSTVAVVANETLFTATSKARMGMEGMISKALNGYNLRTIDDNKYWLNEPEFVNMYHSKYEDARHDKVMVLFREKAEEFRPYDYGLASSPDHRNVVGRVATMCLSDHGGTNWQLHMRFTTYQKMTMTCTTVNSGGATPFRYDNLESTYKIEDPQDATNPTIYALFTMPFGAGEGSALCAYKMRDIRRAMDTQQFWNTDNSRTTLKTTYSDDGPSAPGKCVEDTQRLGQNRLAFARKYTTKFGNIYPSGGKPLYHGTGDKFRHVAVHKMPTTESSISDDVTVLYLTNDDCQLTRVVVNSATGRNWNLPTIDILPKSESNSGMRIQKLVLRDRDVIVTSNRTMMQIPLAACHMYTDCSECVNAMDPYCSWTGEGGCKSVFEINSLEERKAGLDMECPEPVDQQQNSEALIAELQANLTEVEARDYELANRVEALQSKQEEHVVELAECRKMSETYDRTVSNLTLQLRRKDKELQSCKRKQYSLNDQLSLCKMRAQTANAKASAAWKKLSEDIRGGALAKRVKRLQLTNYDIQSELLSCTESFRNCTENLDGEKDKYTQALAKADRAEKLCRVQKNMAAVVLRSQVTALRNASDKMRRSLVATKSKCNATMPTASCHRKVQTVMRDVTRLVEINRNMTRDVEQLEQQHKNNLQLIRQLSWLHKKNGQRGQQRCEYDGWFMSNSTGKLYKLGKDRLGFLQSRTYCRQIGGSLAVFKDPDELRYMNNVVRAFSQRQPFWIGLVKHKNGTLKWQDGSILNPSDLERFPRSQEARLNRSVIYCVELTPSRRWSLVPCQRTRRPICQKNVKPGSADTNQSENYFQVIVKTR